MATKSYFPKNYFQNRLVLKKIDVEIFRRKMKSIYFHLIPVDIRDHTSQRIPKKWVLLKKNLWLVHFSFLFAEKLWKQQSKVAGKKLLVENWILFESAIYSSDKSIKTE